MDNNGYAVSSMTSDLIAQVLFDQSSPKDRYVSERSLRMRVEQAWSKIQTQTQMGELDEAQLTSMLNRLDQFLVGKLSGQHVLYLARLAESEYPNIIPLMPNFLAARYEQLRVARLWSSLLNPEALKRLADAVAIERTISFDN